MELAKKHWKILKKMDKAFRDKVREFLVIGKKGGGVVMATEPNGEGFWYGKMKFGKELSEVTEPTRLGVSGLVSMAQGENHILLLDDRGQCYSMGWNDEGQLGLGIDERDKIHFSPQLISCPCKFISVRGGYAHSLALTEEGKVWGWGHNSYGQLGQPRITYYISSPMQISQLSDHRVVAIACGGWHSLALTDIGEVYAWGNNRSGQLGYEVSAIIIELACYLRTPTKLAIPSPSPVIQISAGLFHTLLLTEDGLVFGCGFCFLKGVENSNVSNLQQISGLPPIAQIYTNLAIALSTERRCWVWGKWRNSQTPTPRKLPPVYSTVESPLSFGSSCRYTPHSVRVKGLQSPHQCPSTSNSDIELEPAPNSLLDRISLMFDNPDSKPDLQFLLGEKSILAHRSILQISGHFSRLFGESSVRCTVLIPSGHSTSSPQSDPIPTCHTTNPSDSDSNTPSIPSITPNITRIPITGHSYHTFHSFIRFFYTGQLQVSPDLLPEFYELSHRFECPDMQRLCLSRMLFNVTLSTCCQYYQLADRHQLSQLQSRVVKFIVDNLLQVFRTEAYRSLDAELARKLTLAIAGLQPKTENPN